MVPISINGISPRKNINFLFSIIGIPDAAAGFLPEAVFALVLMYALGGFRIAFR